MFVEDCKLYCLQSGNTYMAAGNVDDGTHCNSKSGACVAGVCVDMPDYSPPGNDRDKKNMH